MISIFVYEWKHFVRSPFKITALLLFIIAAAYGLHNGARLFHEQTAEIKKLEQKAKAAEQELLGYFQNGEKGPAQRPWVNVTTPYWAIWQTPVYKFKAPDPAMVYNVGQSEQYGFYKKVTFWSSPFDADMTEEIANPERLQFGRLDYGFVVMYLLPLLLLVLLYNIKGEEQDKGSLPLIQIQSASLNKWLFARVAFYSLVILMTLSALFLYGGWLTNVFSKGGAAIWGIWTLVAAYLLLWAVLYSMILRFGSGSVDNTLKMAGIWLLFTFIVPGAIHQYVSIKKPAGLMTDLIDARSDESEQLFNLPADSLKTMLLEKFPEIVDSPVAGDSSKTGMAIRRSLSSLANDLLKESIAEIEQEREAKNILISSSYWYNPVTYFQDRLNLLTATHYRDYLAYRNRIQNSVDQQIEILIPELWNDVNVDEQVWSEYNSRLNGGM